MRTMNDMNRRPRINGKALHGSMLCSMSYCTMLSDL